MTGYLFTALLTVLAVECFLCLPFLKCGENLLEILKRSMRVVTSKSISDCYKEVVLPHYAKILMKETLYLLTMLVSVFLLLALCAFWFDKMVFSNPTTVEVFFTPLNWLWMTLLSISYLSIRSKLLGDGNRD